MTQNPTTIQVEEVPLDRWDEVVQTFPGHTVFQRSPWLSAIADAYDVDPLLLVARRDGRCEAVWPSLVQKVGPFRVVGSPRPGWCTVYLGPLFREDADVPALLSAFMQHPPLRRASYTFCKVSSPGRPVDLEPHGFEHLRDYRTYIVDLQKSEEDLWSALEKRCRKMVRKGARAGLTVRREEGTDYIDDFWKMSVEVFGRSGIKPSYSRRLLDLVVERLTESDSLLVTSAMLEGKRVAMQVMPYDRVGSYAWAAASYAEYRHLAVYNILDWESILEAKRLGISTYDLVSVYGGPGYYKRSFGPEERVTAAFWERYSSPVARMGKKVYASLLRRRQRAAPGPSAEA